MDKQVIFIGGKGGVGKSTSAAATALALSQKHKTLLISTDPAHNLADIFGRQFGHKVCAVDTNLSVCEIDSTFEAQQHCQQIAAQSRKMVSPDSFAQLEKYFSYIAQTHSAKESALFERLAQLLLAEDEFEYIVVDTAPTGHTLRLFSMPKTLSHWAHSLLKQQKRAAYNEEVIGHITKQEKAGDTRNKLQDILQSRYEQYQNLDGLLHHHSRFLLVLNADKLAFEETVRAAQDLKSQKLGTDALILNKLLPAASQDTFLQSRIQLQATYVDKIRQDFKSMPVIEQSLIEHELEKTDYLAIGQNIIQHLLK